MAHYICTGGCKGVSDTPGVCNAEDCVKHGEPLQECSCTDGKHEGMQEEMHKDAEEDLGDGSENIE